MEPTNLSGFNQFFDDPNGTLSKTIALGFDIEASPRLYSGIQYFRRKLESPVLLFDDVITQKRRDAYVSAYVYSLPSRIISLSLEPRFHRYENGDAFDSMTLVELPLFVRWFARNGLRFGASITGVKQKGTFDSSGGTPLKGSDRFAVVSAIATFVLPARLGYISLEGTNLLNSDFRYQEIAAEVAPRYLPTRRVLLRAALQF